MLESAVDAETVPIIPRKLTACHPPLELTVKTAMLEAALKKADETIRRFAVQIEKLEDENADLVAHLYEME